MWNKVIAKAKSGTLTVGNNNYKLPQVFRIKTSEGKVTTANNTDFVNYLSKPKEYNVDGQKYLLTPNQYDKIIEDNKRTEDDEIWEAVKRFVHYDTSQFIEEQIKIENRRRIITTSKGGSNRGQKVDTNTEKTIILPIRK